MKKREIIIDESSMAEITIQPDGRVFVFGTSHALLEILAGLDPSSIHVQQLLDAASHPAQRNLNGINTLSE